MHTMTDHKKNQNQMSPLAAGLTGIVIGAAGAAAIALSDKETRQKATGKAKQMKNDLHKWSSKTIKEMQTRGEEMKAKSRDKQDALEDENAVASKRLKDKIDDTFK